MKLKFFIAVLFSGIFGFSQSIPTNPDLPYDYVEIKEEFDFLVDFTFVNAECATDEISFYSVIIGTTVIGDSIERITVLVPCLGNEFKQGDLITIKPLKTPSNTIAYLSRTYLQDDEEIVQVLGSEFRTIWGEVIHVL